MEMKVFFNIIVVSFNAGDKLADTLDSILNQTYKELRIIIKDGDSTDGSVEKISQKYAIGQDGKTSDGQIILVRGKDGGIYDAMNIASDTLQAVENGQEKADCLDYVYFLNCGDRLTDIHVLEKVRQGILSHAAHTDNPLPSICYGDINECRTGQRVASNPVINDFACYRNIPCHQACFYEVSLILQEKFDTQWQVRADYEHFLRCYYRDKAQTFYLPMIIADYEGGGFSETKHSREMSERERRWIIALYLSNGKILKYDIFRFLTLASLRTKIAENPKTAGIYNWFKKLIYSSKRK